MSLTLPSLPPLSLTRPSLRCLRPAPAPSSAHPHPCARRSSVLPRSASWPATPACAPQTCPSASASTSGSGRSAGSRQRHGCRVCGGHVYVRALCVCGGGGGLGSWGRLEAIRGLIRPRSAHHWVRVACLLGCECVFGACSPRKMPRRSGPEWGRRLYPARRGRKQVLFGFLFLGGGGRAGWPAAPGAGAALHAGAVVVAAARGWLACWLATMHVGRDLPDGFCYRLQLAGASQPTSQRLCRWQAQALVQCYSVGHCGPRRGTPRTALRQTGLLVLMTD